MKKLKEILLRLRDYPKTLYFNLMIFPMGIAFKTPILIKYNVKIHQIERGCIELKGPIKYGMVKIGYNGAGFIPENKSSICIRNGGKIRFAKDCVITEGANIHISGGILDIGENFYANRNLQIQCEEKIEIGDNSLFGWNVNVRDTDGHITYCDSIASTEKLEIVVEPKVWIASNSTILKGSKLSKGSIVGCNSLVCGTKMNENECLLAGIPAKIKKHNITWDK